MLSAPDAYRLRMLLTVLAGTIVLALVAVAIFIVISAATAGPAAGEGADWGAVY